MATKTTKKEARAARRRQAQKKQQIRTLITISVVALVFAFLLIWPSVAPVGEIVEITPTEYSMFDGTTLGDPNAPVVVEVFEDFQCSHCRDFNEDIKPLIVEKHVDTGNVYLIFRQFPILENAPGGESSQAANASMCAAEQNRFWDYETMLFANQTGTGVGAFSDRRLEAFAEVLGLDTDTFNACFEDNAYGDEITADLERGREAGVTGTPMLIVNGTLVENFSFAAVDQAIITALINPSP